MPKGGPSFPDQGSPPLTLQFFCHTLLALTSRVHPIQPRFPPSLNPHTYISDHATSSVTPLIFGHSSGPEFAVVVTRF
jgi:hypothetical protein